MNSAEGETTIPTPEVDDGPAGQRDDFGDTDSALGDDTFSDTTSLATTIHKHREELGRTYHKYRADENQYWGPNDEQQNDQLDIGHHMITMLFENHLYLCPVEGKMDNVIDLGCGTGIWTMDFADTHPDTQVIGVDLSPIQPAWVPPNCKFIVDDVTNEWTYPVNHFDMVHLSCLFGSISDWPALYRTILDHLKPGGWIMQVEMSILFESDDGTIGPEHFMHDWSNTFIDFGEKFGKTFRIANLAGNYIREVGFENVEERWWKAPVGTWAKDKRMKKIGYWNYHYCMEGCEGWALFALVRFMGWSMEAAQAYIAQFRNELKNRNNHAYYKIAAVWGQKPLAA